MSSLKDHGRRERHLKKSEQKLLGKSQFETGSLMDLSDLPKFAGPQIRRSFMSQLKKRIHYILIWSKIRCQPWIKFGNTV